MSEISTGSSFEELIEGLEKLVAQQLATCMQRITKIESKLNSQITNIDDMAKFKMEIIERLEISEKIQTTALNDFDLRINDIEKELQEALERATQKNKSITRKALMMALALQMVTSASPITRHI